MSAVTDVVNIGIGGSHLGPEVVVQALEDWVAPGKQFPLCLERRRP